MARQAGEAIRSAQASTLKSRRLEVEDGLSRSRPRPLRYPNRICARRSDDTEAVSAKHQACPDLAVHAYPDSTVEMGATEMGAAIRCPLVGDST